jgi:hypothetical protein
MFDCDREPHYSLPSIFGYTMTGSDDGISSTGTLASDKAAATDG